MNDNSNDDDDDPLLGSDRNPLSINNDQDDEDENPISDSDDDEGMDHIVYMDRLLLVLTRLFHTIQHVIYDLLILSFTHTIRSIHV